MGLCMWFDFIIGNPKLIMPTDDQSTGETYVYDIILLCLGQEYRFTEETR